MPGGGGVPGGGGGGFCAGGGCNVPAENCSNCPADCPCGGATPSCNPTTNICTHVCGNSLVNAGENCMTCPIDVICPGGTTCNLGICIPFPPPFCTNDGVCLPPETCICADCGCPSPLMCIAGVCGGPPPPTCGGGGCQTGENCYNCPGDCPCAGTCSTTGVCSCNNDGVCVSPPETCSSCNLDCQGEQANCPTGQTCLSGGTCGTCGDGTCTAAEKCGCLVDCSGQSCGPNGRVCSGGSCICMGPSSEVGFCLDGIDNDCDGVTDCNEPECASNLGCMSATETDCSDLLDNDSDGWTDCKDPDCPTGTFCRISNVPGHTGTCKGPPVPSTPQCCSSYESMLGVGPTSQCGNGLDDDCDGQIDCADSDCIGSTACCAVPFMPCSLPSDCCGGLQCLGPSPKSCKVPPPSFVPPTGGTTPGAGTRTPGTPSTFAPTGSTRTTPPSAPGTTPGSTTRTPTVPTAASGLMPGTPGSSPPPPAFCLAGFGCHLGYSGGRCSYLPNSRVGEASTCATPGAPAPNPALMPVAAPLVPGSPASPATVPLTAPSDRCPYYSCHVECVLNRYRLRPGEAGNGDLALAGTGCQSAPTTQRPSLVRRLTTGMRSLLLRRR